MKVKLEFIPTIDQLEVHEKRPVGYLPLLCAFQSTLVNRSTNRVTAWIVPSKDVSKVPWVVANIATAVVILVRQVALVVIEACSSLLDVCLARRWIQNKGGRCGIDQSSLCCGSSWSIDGGSYGCSGGFLSKCGGYSGRMVSIVLASKSELA